MVKVPITPKTIPFMENLVAKYKVGPIFGSHTTYDTLYGFKKAIEKAGGTNNIETTKQLEQVKRLPVWDYLMDPKYHYNLPYPKYITPVVQWQKGEMQAIFPAEFKTGKLHDPGGAK